ncbi:MAG TPA: EAL domain-containing protein [Rhodanobacteraceae bacterium]|nr:EAL domain-containing protein [Rhodanobacteraceae bacterium]
MFDVLPLDLVLYAAQALGAALVAAVLAWYHRTFRHAHLGLWAWSFLALAVYLVFAALGSSVAGAEPAPLGSQTLAAFISQVAGYLQLALAICATRAALGVSRHDDRTPWILWSAVALGVVCTLAWSWRADATAERLFMRVIMHYALAAICFIGIAVALWRRRHQAELGARMSAAAMAAYGLELAHVAAVHLWQWQTGAPVSWVHFTGVVGLVTELFAGFGLVVWLLEDEHNRAEAADVALRRLRDFDPVTGCPNRRRLLADLPHLLRESNQHAALLLLQLDQADTLAGSIGLVAAEKLMAEAAERLEQHTRPGWPRPSRLSETQLVQPIPQVLDGAALTVTANDLLAAMRVPFYGAGQELSLSASIGIALSPEDADTAEALIAAATVAGQRAHDQGGNRFQYYSSEMNTLALTRLGLQGELRRAMLHREMELFYQPLVAGDSHRLVGLEALVRWRHPHRGLLMPDLFIGEMEQLGLIEDLDRLVLEDACREARLWQERHGSEVSVSVNISTRSFQREHFPELVRSILATSGLSASRLEIEIVESGALGNPQRARLTLGRLRELGVRLALDDFGTGYSSLAHLRELPVDCLKIDRSFVNNVTSNPRDAAIVAATITLAHSLGLDVVAEGVENAEQLAWLRGQGVDRMQGYHFSVPLDRKALHRVLESRDQLLASSPRAAAS